jgi:hypothetical protein
MRESYSSTRLGDGAGTREGSSEVDGCMSAPWDKTRVGIHDVFILTKRAVFTLRIARP